MLFDLNVIGIIMNSVSKLFVISTIAASASAWSPSNQLDGTLSRRGFISTAASFVTASVVADQANASIEPLIDELKESKTKMEGIPSLLEQQEWDKVRTILKTPPVNKLWNLGESQNTLSIIAKETGNVDLFELKDELATTIQMCDQLTYDNVFIYFQPGNGKINIKEPVSLAKQAIQQLQRAIDTAKE